MFLFFKASKRDINITSWSYFQILKTWNLDSCPDSVRTTVQMSYFKKSLTMSSVVETHLVGHRYQYHRFGMSFGVKPTIWCFRLLTSQISYFFFQFSFFGKKLIFLKSVVKSHENGLSGRMTSNISLWTVRTLSGQLTFEVKIFFLTFF